MINLTQHQATAEQVAQGVIELDAEDAAILRQWLTFDKLPTDTEIIARAIFIADLALSYGVKQVMIGGAPFLMPALDSALRSEGILPRYAFSTRVSSETVIDGVVTKTNVFKHIGFI